MDATVNFTKPREYETNLQQIRAELGVSRDDLAAEVGIDHTVLPRLERGGRPPTAEVKRKLAEAMRMDLETPLDKPTP